MRLPGTEEGELYANGLYGVWGSGPNDVWAVGRAGAMARWDGSAWSVVAAGLP